MLARQVYYHFSHTLSSCWVLRVLYVFWKSFLCQIKDLQILVILIAFCSLYFGSNRLKKFNFEEVWFIKFFLWYILLLVLCQRALCLSWGYEDFSPKPISKSFILLNLVGELFEMTLFLLLVVTGNSRQVLCHLSHSDSPFHVGYFCDRVSLYAQANLNCDPSI
jgi:hypothetical protein